LLMAGVQWDGSRGILGWRGRLFACLRKINSVEMKTRFTLLASCPSFDLLLLMEVFEDLCRGSCDRLVTDLRTAFYKLRTFRHLVVQVRRDIDCRVWTVLFAYTLFSIVVGAC
jgi:hypothetical protein